MRSTGIDRGHGIGHRHMPVVMHVNPNDSVETGCARPRQFSPRRPVSTPPFVSQRQSTSAPASRAASKVPQRKRGVCLITVKEVFRIVDHFPAVLFQVADRFADERQVLLFCNPQRHPRMQIPALAEYRHRWRSGFNEQLHVAVFRHRVARKSRGTEGYQPRMLELHLTRALEKFLVFRVGARPAAFNIVNAKLVQLLRNYQLVFYGEADGFALSFRPGASYRR